MEDTRQHLLSLLAYLSFKLGHKTSTGSDYHLDCRLTTLHAEGARLTARVVLDEIRRRGWTPRAIGGMSLGAYPIVAAVAMLSAQERLRRSERAPAGEAEAMPPDEELRAAGYGFIHGFLLHKAEKSHALEQQVEGYREPGAQAIIVEDVCTTGASTISAIRAARACGFEIEGVLCLVECEEAMGRSAVEQASAPAPFVHLFTLEEVSREHLRQEAAAGGTAR